MKIHTISTAYAVYKRIEELPLEVQKLMNAAIKIKDNAYAPYSNFKVGAALLMADGSISVGNNQENAAYPSGLCAERVAIFHASAKDPKMEILTIAIVASCESNTVSRPVGPCGACRQVLTEYEVKQQKEIEIYFMGEIGDIIRTNSVADLLPFGFDKSYL
ncbi:MAG: cytidine deaminase [Flavobacteriaceae bacterium]|nr:MAG: cytidine deaminase [Flavobacteriaceae bacterium]